MSPFWNKVDYLLFSCGITHLHFKTRNGRGIGDGLIFCVVNDECIYILSCGVHHDLYRPDDLVNIAETNWPGEVFGDVDEISKVENYNKRQANDPSLQYNMLKPLNVLSGPRHTVTATLNESDGEINHVPMLAFCAYENELKYLEKIENDFTEKYGLAVKLKMNIDFSKRKYLIKTGFPFQLPYEIDFSSDTTCSGLVSDSFL